MEEEKKRSIRLASAWPDDIAITELLAKLSDDEMEIIGDSLLAAVDAGCDEFFHRLFEALLPGRIGRDPSGKWNAVREMLAKLYGES